MSDPIAAPATSTSESEMSTAETLTGIFFEPSRTYDALRARPRFLVAGLIILAIAGLVTLVLYTRVDMGQYMRERIQQSPNADQISEQQMEMQVRVGKIFGAAVIPLSVPIIIAGGAGIYLLGVMMFGGSITYKKALSVWTYSSIPPSVVGALIAIVVLFLKSADTIDPEHLVATNPGALMSENSSKVLVAILGQFDLLRFYGMFLAALGLRKLGKVSSGSAWGIVIGLWLLGLLLRTLSAAIFGR